MLELEIPAREAFDEDRYEFITTKPTVLRLEHSLVSISKWESIYEKPFLNDKDKTLQETLDYIKCMTISQNVDPNIYKLLNNEELAKIEAYISKKSTATTIKELSKDTKTSGQFVTSELIYYWMFSLGISMECQKWHINRLITLIRVMNEKQKPSKKMPKAVRDRNNTALNAARRKRLGTKG